MRYIQTLSLTLLCATLLCTQSGCLVAAAAGAAAGTVAYVSGDLEATLDAKPDAVIEATKLAAADLGFRTEYANGSSIDGQAKLRTGADKEIFIKTRALGDKSSKISIRVGTFGDESVSQMVLEKIRTRLPAPATTTTTAAPTPAA